MHFYDDIKLSQAMVIKCLLLTLEITILGHLTTTTILLKQAQNI